MFGNHLLYTLVIGSNLVYYPVGVWCPFFEEQQGESVNRVGTVSVVVR
jgi:hypothetical protein